MQVPGKIIPLRAEQPKVDPVYYAMAIAQMHGEGKLSPGTPDPSKPPESPDGNR